MSKQVYFKFKSCLTQYAIPFEGSNISCSDLKLAIRKKCAINFCDLTLLIKDSDKNIERVCSDNELIPAFSNVIVIRSPIATDLKTMRNQKTINPENFNKIDPYKNNTNNKGIGDFFKNINLATSDMTEEEKLDSVVESGSNNYCLTGKRVPMGLPPPSYKCNKCGIPGHWINACPGIPDKNGKLIDSRLVKRPSGIPVCRLTEVDENTPNSYLTPDGRYVVNIKNREAVLKGKKEKRPFSKEENPPFQKSEENIPMNLICGLCSKMLMKPTKIPCCGTVYCEACVTERLFVPSMDFEIHTCPNCGSLVDKLDSLKESDNHNYLINEWLKEKIKKNIDLEEIKNESTIKEETIVKPPCEMTDDDLLNEILCMSNKENDVPENNINKKDDRVDLESNMKEVSIPIENLTSEIFNQFITGCQRPDIKNLVKTNPEVTDVIEGIVMQMLPNYLKVLEAKHRSRSRERYRYRKEYPVSKKFDSGRVYYENHRRRSRNSYDHYIDKVERTNYFSENRTRRLDDLDVNKESDCRRRHRRRSSIEESIHYEEKKKKCDRYKSPRRKIRNQEIENDYRKDMSKKYFSKECPRDNSSSKENSKVKNESRYDESDEKLFKERLRKNEYYEDKFYKKEIHQRSDDKYRSNNYSNRNHRDNRDSPRSSNIYNRSKEYNSDKSSESKRRRSISNSETYQENNYIHGRSIDDYDNNGKDFGKSKEAEMSMYRKEEIEYFDRIIDKKRKYRKDRSRSKYDDKSKSNEIFDCMRDHKNMICESSNKYSANSSQNSKEREKSPIIRNNSFESNEEHSLQKIDGFDKTKESKDKSHKKSKKSKKNKLKSKHSDKKKHKKSKYLSD